MNTDFRTPLISNKGDLNLNHSHQILLVGSCFSTNIGEQLKQRKFNVRINPYGISYHPLAIHRQLQLTTSTPIEIEEHEGKFFSYHFHSELNTHNKALYQSLLQQQIRQTTADLKTTDYLIITYGTAWVYEVLKSGQIANNCHQQPSNNFNKRLLHVEEIVHSWNKTRAFIKEQYGNMQILFTISPVRHLKDGFHENQLSKSTLQLAVHEICKAEANCSYFPSYEIMMDDLRDYRFYKDDFIHPNQLAIDYIWKAFSKTYFTDQTTAINEQIEKLTQAINHRAFQPHSNKHQQFLKKLAQKLQTFQANTTIDVSSELEAISEQIL